MPLVLQDLDAVALDLRVGRIEVDHVDLARSERLVGEAMIEAARLLRQAVGFPQPRPAVAPAEELVRQPDAGLGMLRQFGEGLERKARPERITVTEAQWNRRSEPERLQPRVQRGKI